MTGTTRLNVCLLVSVLTGMLLGEPPAQPSVWHWDQWMPLIETWSNGNNLLTRNNGEHAIGVTEYSSGGQTKAWCSFLSRRGNSALYAYEYTDWG